ncbi:uncharacterized protein LOC115689095 [Syzygium oleosum]|uniref:uncharacterized protein LOC115689095 n=1 Tax=Syzygium oleosum TaxID=219896 RepID=UPI0011D1FD56|nr:uncharacterized protein LOC115689095 [Syzygium oleosum]
MERTSAELENYSLSRNNLSRFKPFKPSGRTEVGKEIEPHNMEGPRSEAPTSGLGDLVIKEAGGSSSTPQRSDSRTELRWNEQAIRVAQIKVFDERLKILEEENNTLKRTFFEAVKDRRRLADEIYEQFWIVDRTLHARDQFRGTSAPSVVSKSKDLEIRRTGTGLSLVLCQYSNPLVLSKECRTTIPTCRSNT